MLRKGMSFWLGILGILILAIGVGCSSGGSKTSTDTDSNTGSDTEAEGDVVKVGVIVAETGPASTLGASMANTAKLIQKQLNEKGDINGHKVELVIMDYETDDTKAVVAMDNLISDGVAAVVGSTQTSTTMAIMPRAVEQDIPLLTTAPMQSEDEFVFGMCHNTITLVKPIIDYLIEEGITKVAWLNAADGFGVTGLPPFEVLADEHGIEVIAHEEFDATATDMTVQLTKVRGKDPEAIIVWSRTPGAGIVARNFRALDFDIPMIQSTAASGQGFLEQVEDDNENIFVLGSKLSVIDQLEDSEQKQLLEQFSNAYEDEYGSKPDLFAAHVYDGIHMVIDAIENDNTTPGEIQQYLKGLGSTLGVTGTYNFQEDQYTPDYDGISLLKIEDNQWSY